MRGPCSFMNSPDSPPGKIGQAAGMAGGSAGGKLGKPPAVLFSRCSLFALDAGLLRYYARCRPKQAESNMVSEGSTLSSILSVGKLVKW